MEIELFEPALVQEKGFFNYLFFVLIHIKCAKLITEPRPLPRLMKPREHSSAWARFDGHLVCFDYSDHIFLYDIDALKKCDVYIKANFHRDLTRKVLEKIWCSST